MRSEQIKEAVKAEPFEPFWLRTADGREYYIPHPEFILVTPEGRTAMVVGQNDVVTMLDVMLITALHFEKHKRNGKGRGGKRKSA